MYQIFDLTVEKMISPMAIDEKKPRFGWKILSDIDDVKQTSYRIVVKDKSSIVWDSGIVSSGESVWIEYSGCPLRPMTEYFWTVESYSNDLSHSAGAKFETGLMDTSISAWRGAKWIGSSEMSLAARAKSIFSITLNFYMKGLAVGVVFGKNDPRLLDKNKNDYGIAGENYIKYRVSREGVLSVYRVGYCPLDTDKPIAEVNIPDFSPDTAHSLRIDVTGNNAYAYLDDVRVDEIRKEFPPFMKRREGMPDFIISPRQLNPAGENDLTTYPLLCESGFFAEGEAEILKFAITDIRPPKATLVRVEASTPHQFAEYVNHDRLVIKDVELTADFSYGAIPMLKREFTEAKKPVKARLYATARGVYDISINGKPITENLFEPGASQYDKHIRYQAYDVTELINSGVNQIDATLSSGWWNESQTFTLMNYNYWGNRQSLLLMLVKTYSDGTEDTIVSSPNEWLCRTDGCVKFAGWFYGEHYDARKVCNPNWLPAVEVPTVDFSELYEEGAFMRWPVPSNNQPEIVASIGTPVRRIMTLTAQRMIEPRKGVYVYDMGQNMVGVPSVTMRGKKDTEAVFRYGEVLYPALEEYGDNAGMILTENYRDALSIDRYVFCDDSIVTYSPEHTFHGYRYIEITGVSEPPKVQDVKGIVISSITELTGDFACSDERVNRLYKNIRWSQYSNYLSIPTDCPQRNERMGWSGDAQVFSRTATYNSDVYGFLRQYLECERDCQLDDGRYPDIAPVGGGFGGIEWGSAGVIITYEVFKQYGDKRVIEENYAAMVRYMDFLLAKGTPGKLDNVGPLGDWLATDMSTDTALLWNSFYYLDASFMSEMASAIGLDSDREKYSALAREIKKNWNEVFFDKEAKKTRGIDGSINDTQASYAVPLYCGVFEDSETACDRLNEKTKELDYAVTAGFVGAGPLCPALSDGGHTDTAYEVLTGDKYPSWLYSITEGATTIWERWNSMTKENGFGGNNSMNSFNHYSLGAVGTWLYQYVLGIRRGEKSWRRFIVKPEVGKFEWARGSFESVYGDIRAEWTRNGGKVEYTLTVPANTEADVILPIGTFTVGSGKHGFVWNE